LIDVRRILTCKSSNGLALTMHCKWPVDAGPASSVKSSGSTIISGATSAELAAACTSSRIRGDTSSWPSWVLVARALQEEAIQCMCEYARPPFFGAFSLAKNFQHTLRWCWQV